MTTKTLVTFAAAITFVFAGGVGKAYAHPYHGHPGYHYPPPYYHDDGDFLVFLTALLGSVTLTELTEDTAYEDKVAIADASADAAAVLNNGPATDLFLNGKDTAEAILKVTFASDEEAAMAIVELNELFSENN